MTPSSPVSTDATPTPLVAAAIDTEKHVSKGGWDQPARMFALVSNRLLLDREPSMAAQLQESDPRGYSAVEQEGVPNTNDLESMLGRVAWPTEVDGVALSVERIVVPPDAERDLPNDKDEATEVLAAHPDRQDVRLLVAVLRSGESVCLLRQRRYDSDDAVALGNDIAPGLVHALKATLSE